VKNVSKHIDRSAFDRLRRKKVERLERHARFQVLWNSDIELSFEFGKLLDDELERRELSRDGDRHVAGRASNLQHKSQSADELIHQGKNPVSGDRGKRNRTSNDSSVAQTRPVKSAIRMVHIELLALGKKIHDLLEPLHAVAFPPALAIFLHEAPEGIFRIESKRNIEGGFARLFTVCISYTGRGNIISLSLIIISFRETE
jgi:hypothetical protein